MSFLGLNRLRRPDKSDSPKTNIINGFIVDSSKTTLAKWIFKTYPETAINIPSLNQELKTKYMNVLLGIARTLYDKKSRCNISDDELSNASKSLSDLTQAGFNVEWLRSKLEEVSLERKMRSDSEARILELKEEVKKLEVMMSNLNVDLKNEKAKLNKL